jgi:ubiquinone/menaquinone biosynthesis C-methylase UbiE
LDVPVEEHEYQRMFDMEEDYWWYVGLHRLVLDVLCERRLAGTTGTILDAGCGTGRLITLLQTAGFQTVGIDSAGEALRLSTRRGIGDLVQASVEHIPCRTDTFDLLVSLDVLSCLDADRTRRTFGEMRRVIKSGGYLVLNLPAYDFLRSSHDAAQHIVHRFSRGELRSLLREAGFALEVCTYRNTLLLPLFATVRLLRRYSTNHNTCLQSDLRPIPRRFNSFMTRILLSENRFIRKGLHLPAGLSLFCIARNPQ